MDSIVSILLDYSDLLSKCEIYDISGSWINPIKEFLDKTREYKKISGKEDIEILAIYQKFGRLVIHLTKTDVFMGSLIQETEFKCSKLCEWCYSCMSVKIHKIYKNGNINFVNLCSECEDSLNEKCE